MDADSITIRRTYKYRLYTSKHNRHLYDRINIAGQIWNHALALQKRFYRRHKKYISLKRMQAFIANLRMRTRRYAHWKMINSQTTQEVCERLDTAYQRFFKHISGFPRFKKVKKFSSFMLKQYGWKLLGGNRVQLYDRVYRFVKHREMAGKIKTVVIKRDAAGQLWICFSVMETLGRKARVGTGQIGGMDFGLQTFLTDEQGRGWMMPEFFKQELKIIKQCHRAMDHKVLGSGHWEQARLRLVKAYIRHANKRRDFHFKLAHALFRRYDVVIFEDLNLDGMKRLWGRKVSDLAFGKFLKIIKHLSILEGTVVHQIERFTPTTQRCSVCGHYQKLALKQRVFTCKACGLVLNRDHNAARNIQKVGSSTFG